MVPLQLRVGDRPVMRWFWCAVLLVGCWVPAVAQQPAAAIAGRVIEAGTGSPIRGALVEIAGPVLRATSDPAGRFIVRGVGLGTVATVRASSPGFAPVDTTIVIRNSETVLILALKPRVVALDPISVRAESHGGAAERALYEQEVVPGLVGVSGQEIRSVPALGETDVLRALQAVPGVVTVNDLSAELHVRGGASDQNLILLDGARVFAPYHLFGLFGAFNSDAISRAEFYRGAFPARYGGALSSVIEIEQRGGADERVRLDGGVGLLGARMLAAGALPHAEGRWMIAGRRSHADLAIQQIAGDTFPYAFHDLQGRVSLAPGAQHRVRASWFTSSDRYRMFFGSGNDDLHSRWRNLVGSVGWEWVGGDGRSAAVTTWHSRYSGSLVVGNGPEAPATNNRVAITGLRAEFRRAWGDHRLRGGLEAEVGGVELAGSDSVGSYVTGQVTDPHTLTAGYLEGDRRFGRLRFTPGIRAVHDGRNSELLIEPRLAARYHLSDDLAITFGAGRAHQVLTSLRDERFVLPGPPLWLSLPGSARASRTDGLSAAVEAWRGEAWSYRLEVYARRFDGVPRWRPMGSRDPSTIEFNQGSSEGVELFARRHAGRLTGWASYTYSRTQLEDESTGRSYEPTWDRRHSGEATLAWQATSYLALSGRSTYGSGLPFWPFTGYVNAPRLVPILGQTQETRLVPEWSDTQMRYPAYFRVDLAARGSFRYRRLGIEPVLSIQNLTARPNVLYYRLTSADNSEEAGSPGRLVPVAPFPILMIPSLGIDVHF